MDTSENREISSKDPAAAPSMPPTEMQKIQQPLSALLTEGEEVFLDESEEEEEDEDEDEEMDEEEANVESSYDTGNETESTSSDEHSASEDEDGIESQGQASNDHQFSIFPKQSYGSRFANDLQDGLSGNLLSARDAIYFERLLSAPNPCLSIEGLGSIGVPVSSRDADAFPEVAVNASDIELGPSRDNVCSIESSKISFGNPQWTAMIHAKTTQTVWTALGIAPYLAPARCTLRKIVVIKPGPLNVEDLSADDDKTFAYVVVQLPSSHAGGQAQVVQKTRTQEIDLGEQPLTMSVFAFYKGSNLRFRPIVKGYRVALVYGLAAVTNPELPVEAPMAVKLRRVFTKWTKNQYRTAPSKKQFVYILNQRKTPLPRERNPNVSSSIDTPVHLTSRDGEAISCLRSVAREFGYVIFPGELSYRMQGRSYDAPQGSYWERGSDWDDEPEYPDIDDMSLDEVHETSAEFRRMTGPDGTVLHEADVDIKIKNIIPAHFFEGLPPDEKDWEGDMSYDYYRAAVLVVPEEKQEKILRKANNEYWLSRWERLDLNHADPLEAQRIRMVLSRAERDTHHSNDRDSELRRLMKLTLKWRDLDLWSKTAGKLNKAIDAHEPEDLVEAWSVFSHERFIPIIDTMLVEAQPKKRLAFVKKFGGLVSLKDQELATHWTNEQYIKVLTSVPPPDISDVLAIGRERGVTFLARIIEPHFVEHPPDIIFVEKFVSQLRQRTALIPDSVPAQAADDSQEPAMDKFCCAMMNNTLDRPKYQIFGIQSTQTIPPEHRQQTFTRLQIAINFHLLWEENEECALPLRLILHTDHDHYQDVMQSYDRIFKNLRRVLGAYKVPMTTPPFKDFFAAVIGLRLQSLLDIPKPRGRVNIDTFGCKECDYCLRIDRFLRTRNQAHFHEPINTEREWGHLFWYISPHKALAKFQLGPKPRGRKYHNPSYLTITDKHIQLQPVDAWEAARAKPAQEYLDSMGSNDEIASLMGDDYPRIQMAVKGESSYTMSPRFINALGEITRERLEMPVPVRRPFQSAIPGRSALSDSSNHPKPIVVETQKRKLDSDDLTEPPLKRVREE